MKRAILAALLLVALIPVMESYSQLQDKEPTLAVALTEFAPYHYKDAEGYTIIIGEVENQRDFPVTEIKLGAKFFDEINEQPLDSTISTTLLDVVPPHGKSPYMIKSPSPNSAITNVAVNVLGFNSANVKLNQLVIEAGDLEVTDDNVSFSGIVQNTGSSHSENTDVHLIVYDSFIPPRLLRVMTFESEESIAPGSFQSFSFEMQRLEQAAGLRLFAESDKYLSTELDVKIFPPELISKRVTINDVTVNDPDGNRLSTAPVGSTLFFESSISSQGIAEDSFIQLPYVYYVQVVESKKVSGETKSFVEFVGSFEGRFDEPGFRKPLVEWTPEKSGLYFVETYVWTPQGIPLASQGPVVLVLVN